jgi:two-component system sensor histidine kinase PilS (NtrC family)
MNDTLLQEGIIEKRIRWLMLSRIALVTILFSFTAFIKLQKTDLFPEISLTPLYILFAVAYAVSMLYLCILKFRLIENPNINIYIQSFSDVALVTGLVYATGGVTSVYSVLYPLVIIYAVLFLQKRGGLIIATFSSILYGLLIDLEYYRIIHPIYTTTFYKYDLGSAYVFSQIAIHVLSFYIIVFLASFVVAQEKKAWILLAEKETAFDQLDLLHRSIIESIDTGIMTINLRGMIKSFNRAAEEISGFSFAEVENRSIVELFSAFKEIEEKITNNDDNKSYTRSRYNMEFEGKDHKKLTLGCSVSNLKDHRGKRIGDIVIFQDLTSIIKMEKSLEKSRRLAIIGEMAAGLAHEMRNPLASLGGSIQILKKDLSLNPVDERLMQIILRGKEQLDNIIKDFLLLARPAPGKKEAIVIKDIIEDVIESIKLVPDWSDNIEISLSLSDNIGILANRTELREIFWNLILNSIQAMNDGGALSIEMKNISSSDAAAEHLEIKIHDTGSGIDEKNLEMIFEPFFTTKETGTGLGLAIVNRIVEGYGGTIRIENNGGAGTTCVVSFPFHK